METLTCALDECNVQFIPVTHNQKYCTTVHTRMATNKKLMERYWEAQAIKHGKKRICKKCNSTQLSRYNPTGVCAGCQSSSRTVDDDNITGIASIITMV